MVCFGTSKIIGLIDQKRLFVLADCSPLNGCTFQKALELFNDLESIQSKGKPRRTVVVTIVNGRSAGFFEKVNGVVSSRLVFPKWLR
jgi:hypothetical protein